ncbi:MAG: LytTR family DNA-binding domain-containing protein [Oceanicaulis sp.]
MTRLLAALFILIVAAAPALAQVWSVRDDVRVCPAEPGETAPPDFTAQPCETTPFWAANAQNRTIWIEAVIDLERAPDPLSGPYALFLSGKMAVEAQVNGAVIGANGVPGFNAADETAGRMDTALFLPAQLLRAGENRVVLKASGHHSLIELAAPTHRIAIGAFADPRRRILAGYQGSLVTSGAFALALIFFAGLALLSPRRASPSLLAAIALIAGFQLIAEAGRGLFAYRYPVQDLRLLALVAGAAGLALLTAGWSLVRFAPPKAIVSAGLLGGLAVVILLIVIFAQGFDDKAALSLMAGAVAAAAPPAWRAWRLRKLVPALWAMGFLVFAASGVLAPYSLLDRTVFWALSALLLMNVLAEARRFAAERARREGETRRADTLAAALARVEQAAHPVQIALNSAGRTDYADAADIARLNAADDYVELVFKDGRTLLHTGALAKLEAQLPANFLRVHRSCIVNTDEIEALEREAGGSGRLILKTAGEAPVSRRILPKVRAALDPT